jgi:hypothetical protein
MTHSYGGMMKTSKTATAFIAVSLIAGGIVLNAAPAAQAGQVAGKSPMSAAGVALMDATKDVTKVRTDATNLRAQVKALLQGYMDKYGDRFNASDLAQLKALQSSADRQMVGVIAAVNTLRTAIVQKKSASAVAKAKTAATTAWSNAKKNAETSWGTARGIMEPKLSLFEKIGPLNDYNSMMTKFDELGAAIATVKVK